MPDAGPGDDQWEYLVFENRNRERPLVDSLNDLGRAGWEAVSLVWQPSYAENAAFVALLKRRLQSRARGAD